MTATRLATATLLAVVALTFDMGITANVRGGHAGRLGRLLIIALAGPGPLCFDACSSRKSSLLLRQELEHALEVIQDSVLPLNNGILPLDETSIQRMDRVRILIDSIQDSPFAGNPQNHDEDAHDLEHNEADHGDS